MSQAAPTPSQPVLAARPPVAVAAPGGASAIALAQGVSLAVLTGALALMPGTVTGALLASAAVVSLAGSSMLVWRLGKTQVAAPEAQEPRVAAAGSAQAGSLFEQASRLHLADRVAFLRACDRVMQAETDQAVLEVRLDVAGENQPARFVERIVTIRPDGQGVHVAYAVSDGSRAEPVRQSAAGTEPVRETGNSEALAIARQKKLLAIVSHELRTPLNAIIGFSDMLRSGLAGELGDARQREYVDLIASSGEELLGMVNTILDVSKIDAGAYSLHREPFDLAKTIADSVRLLEARAQAKGIHLTVRPLEDVAETVADRRAVRQVLINLLSNAVKFTPEGGCIGVEAVAMAGGGFTLTVTDTGIGMSQEQLDTIGTPFAQGDSSYGRESEGTGLGLALVKGLVELHGGKVAVKSNPDIGTAFTVSFPCPVAAAGPGQQRCIDLDENPYAAMLQRKAG